MPVRNKTYKALQEKHDILNTVYQSGLGETAHLQAENKQFEQIATDRQTQNNRLAEELANLQREFAQLKEQCVMVTQDWTETTAENEKLKAETERLYQLGAVCDDLTNRNIGLSEDKSLLKSKNTALQQRLQAAHDLLTRADDIFRFIPVSRQSATNRLQIAQWRVDVREAMNGVERKEEESKL